MTDISPERIERADVLKPCPFCGGSDLKSGGDDKVVGYRCNTCEACGPNQYGKFEWNNRAANMRAEEREAFEAWCKSRYVTAFDRNPIGTWGDEKGQKYVAHFVQTSWEGWQARAALTSDASAIEGAREDYKLPCEVALPPATIIGKGVPLRTLLIAAERRKAEGVEKFDRPLARQPDPRAIEGARAEEREAFRAGWLLIAGEHVNKESRAIDEKLIERDWQAYIRSRTPVAAEADKGLSAANRKRAMTQIVADAICREEGRVRWAVAEAVVAALLSSTEIQ